MTSSDKDEKEAILSLLRVGAALAVSGRRCFRL